MPDYRGLIAAPFTPFHADGTVNLEMVPKQVAALVNDGVTGAFVCGTTGEGLSLSTAERRAMTEAWCAAAPTGFDVYVHVGHAVLREAQALAEHAAAVGAAAIAAMPASPFASDTIEDLTSHLAGLATAAPETPLLYYHIPSFSHVKVSVVDLLRFAGTRVPTLVGIKFTHEDLMDYARAAALEGGRFKVLFGRDELYLAGLALGAQGAVGSTYNFAAPLVHEIASAFAAGDMETARRAQVAHQEVVAAVLRYPGLAAQKHLMVRLGFEFGPVRAPSRGLTARETDALDRAVDAAGFPDVCRVGVSALGSGFGVTERAALGTR